ncbi:MAG TPA: RluA family pseudouridine synthase [Candidatus Binatia bacterium]|nr:RluA family pseudouridine synthase [Candidatus Binatia bacterium]
MPAIEYRVPADSPPQRLDVFLARVLPNGSRQRAQTLIASDAVRVNGRRRTKGSLVATGDVVRVEGDAAASPAALPDNPDLRVPILYEDPDILVVDKPAGMPSHALRLDERTTLANFLVTHFPDLRTVGPKPGEVGLVHRLDTDTSGLLLVARNEAAYSSLRGQFAQRAITKEYVAVVGGDLSQAGEIHFPIAHDPRNPRRMRACVSADEAHARRARPALTRYRPLQRGDHATLVAVEIPTGVMHQIRVHLATIGHPIVGDDRYGGAPAVRQLLHARRITFAHPRTGRRVNVESPAPRDIEDYLAEHVRRRPK